MSKCRERRNRTHSLTHFVIRVRSGNGERVTPTRVGSDWEAWLELVLCVREEAIYCGHVKIARVSGEGWSWLEDKLLNLKANKFRWDSPLSILKKLYYRCTILNLPLKPFWGFSKIKL